MRQVDSVIHYGGALLALGLNDAGGKASAPLLEVRAAVQWPTGEAPGYYLIMGRKAEKNAEGKNALLFLGEGQKPLPRELYEACTDDLARLRAAVIYADKGKQGARLISGHYTDFYDYLSARQLSIDLTPAPSAQDKEYGVVLVREHMKNGLLELPGVRMTIVRSQIRDMTEGGDYERFYAFHALRYLLAGFAKYQELVVGIWSDTRRREPKSAQGWT